MSKHVIAGRAGHGWKPASMEPPHNPEEGSLGTEYVIHPPTSGGDRTAFYGRRLGGAACWYLYGAPVHGVEYWHELPADPAALTAAQQPEARGVVDVTDAMVKSAVAAYWRDCASGKQYQDSQSADHGHMRAALLAALTEARNA